LITITDETQLEEKKEKVFGMSTAKGVVPFGGETGEEKERAHRGNVYWGNRKVKKSRSYGIMLAGGREKNVLARGKGKTGKGEGSKSRGYFTRPTKRFPRDCPWGLK